MSNFSLLEDSEKRQTIRILNEFYQTTLLNAVDNSKLIDKYSHYCSTSGLRRGMHKILGQETIDGVKLDPTKTDNCTFDIGARQRLLFIQQNGQKVKVYIGDYHPEIRK